MLCKDVLPALHQAISALDPSLPVALFFPGEPGGIKASGRLSLGADSILTLVIPDQESGLPEIRIGMRVQITQTLQEIIFFLEGTVQDVSHHGGLEIRVAYPGTVVKSQRRLFYRFNLKKTFLVDEVVLPNGEPMASRRVVLQDMSPEGIGFRVDLPLPVGTRFTARELIHPLPSGMADMAYVFQVVWSRGNRWLGYRTGATFIFLDTDQEKQLVEVLNRIQIDRLAWVYRSLNHRLAATGAHKPAIPA